MWKINHESLLDTFKVEFENRAAENHKLLTKPQKIKKHGPVISTTKSPKKNAKNDSKNESKK